MRLHRVLDYVFRQPVPAAPILDGQTWWRRHRDLAAVFPQPGALAVVAGFVSDRVAWAFASGYQSALRALEPALGPDDLAALCVTEHAGNGPRDIATTVELRGDRVRVRGTKSFVTLGTLATDLLVVGVSGELRGRPRLSVVRLRADDPGVRVTLSSPTPFAPELPHGVLEIDTEVPVERLNPGDGWDRQIKPFGGLEDALVRAALCGHLIAVGRASGWPDAELENLASCAVTLAAFDDVGDLRSPAVWRALEGALGQADAAFGAANARLEGGVSTPQAAPEGPAMSAAERWLRDRALVNVAGKRRHARTARARAAQG